MNQVSTEKGTETIFLVLLDSVTLLIYVYCFVIVLQCNQFVLYLSYTVK